MPPAGAGALRIVHAPSDRARKGTDAVLAAVEQLRAEGVEIELELVEGKPRAEARRAYERADVLVDQLVVGWYGGVAVEAMALGKPVVARIDPSALARVPARMRDELPIVHADADDRSPEVLRRLADGTARRARRPRPPRPSVRRALARPARDRGAASSPTTSARSPDDARGAPTRISRS